MKRWLTYNIIRVAAFWSLWWLIGSIIIQLGVPKLLDLNRENGGRSELTVDSVRGFPGHFGITLSDIALSNPSRTTEWVGDALNVKLRAWNPTHANIIFPPAYRLRTEGVRYTVSSISNETEIAFSPGLTLKFKKLVGAYSDLTIQSSKGASFAVEKAAFDIRPAKATDYGFDINVDISALKLPPQLRREIDLSYSLSDTIALISLDAVVDFDKDWTPFEAGASNPQPTEINLKNFELLWDGLSFSAQGDLEIDRAGQARGTIYLQTENWRRLVELAAANGKISASEKAQAETGLAVLSGGKDALRVPLVFQDGFMSLGPVPIGQAPVFRIADRPQRPRIRR